MKNETKRMAAWVFVQILFVVSLLLFVGGCSRSEPSWKMLSRGADAIFRDLDILDKESSKLLYVTRDKPGGSDLAWELQKVAMKARDAKWIAKEVGEKMRVLYEQEERRKVLDKTE